MERTLDYIIPSGYSGKKLESFLRNEAGFSYRFVRSLKQKRGTFILNGVTARSIDIISAGDRLRIVIPEENNKIEPLCSEIDIIYEDSDLLIINKPAGLAMHPTHNHQGDTLANAVSYYLQSKGQGAVFRSVGRLDKNTSGIVICALNKLACSKLSGNVKKTYIAIVEGNYSGKGTIDLSIIRPDPMKTIRSVGINGEAAITSWEALFCNSELSLLKVCPQTGRTHQIRTHFSALGTPLAGDEMYGGKTDLISRHALHCSAVSFNHPISNTMMSFTAELPPDMQKLKDLIFSENQ